MNTGTSIRSLVLLGFVLVALPLMVGLIGSLMRVDRLSQSIQTHVESTSRIVELGQFVVSQVLALESAAELYQSGGEQSSLDRYHVLRKQLLEAIDQLSELPIAEDARLTLLNLKDREHALASELGNPATLPDLKPRLRPASALLPEQISASVSLSIRSTNRRVERVQKLLFIQAVAVIPLALILATVFGLLITRSLGQVVSTIRRLGSGDFSTPVLVNGPADIRELGNHLDWLRENLATIDQQKREFMQHVSHELKTPLTAIREASSLLNDEISGKLNPAQKEILQILDANSIVLQREVEALLEFNLSLAKISLDQLSAVDFDQLIPDIISQRQLELNNRGLVCETRLQPVCISANPRYLRTLFDNLLSNAIKFSPDTGKIRVSLRRTATHAVLDVVDQGPGISATDKDLVFKPFYQNNQPVRAAIKGTGLGLAIAHRYVTLHHGQLTVEPCNSGAHLRVVLPLAQPSTQPLQHA